MRNLERVLLVLSLAAIGGMVRAQDKNETFSAASGGDYDASVCNDPSIAIMAKQQNATPYHDPDWNTPGDPLREALGMLAQKYDNGDINRAGACKYAPGVVYMVPKNLIPEVTKLIGQIEATESGGDSFNGNSSGNVPSGDQPAGTSGTKGGPSGPGGNRGGPGPDYRPIPGPAGGIGYTSGPNACLPKGPGGYNYCDNPPGTRLPPGCSCGGSTPLPADKSLRRGPPAPDQPLGTQLLPPSGPPDNSFQSNDEPPNLQLLQQAMNGCLRVGLPYWADRILQPTSMFEARLAAPKSGSFSKSVSQLPARSQVFLAETAMAMEAQTYHDRLYGPARTEQGQTPAEQRDFLVGWLDHCLADAGLAPVSSDNPARNPRNAYASFLGVDETGPRSGRFGSGYSSSTKMFPPASLLPPRTPIP